MRCDSRSSISPLTQRSATRSWSHTRRFAAPGPSEASRGVLRGLTPLAATAYASLFGTAMLAIVATPDLLRLDRAALSPGVIASVLYLGLLGTGVAFVWYYRAVQRLGPSRTVIFNNLVPVFGAAFGVTLLGEPLLPSMVAGGAMAVTGVMLVSRG